MFKTTWKQLEKEMPVIFVSYNAVEKMIEDAGAKHGGDWDLYAEFLERLKGLDIYTDKPVATHRSPSFGSD